MKQSGFITIYEFSVTDAMKKKRLQIYFGDGRGKTIAAIGLAIRAASEGKSVFIIEFLKERHEKEIQFIQRLEPEIKLFRFQRREKAFADLDHREKSEEVLTMKNAFNFAKKVLATGECEVLILDELLGLLEYGIITTEDVQLLLEEASDETELIFTGTNICSEIMDWASSIYQISTIKEE